MADVAQAQRIGEVVGPEGNLRSALEKTVFTESRISQLQSELGAALTTARRRLGDAQRRDVELTQATGAEGRGRKDTQARSDHMVERVRLEREPSEGCPIFGYGPHSKGTADIEAAQQKALERVRNVAALAADAAGA